METVETAQRINYLLHKCKDQSSNPEDPQEASVVVQVCKLRVPTLPRWKAAGNPGKWEARQHMQYEIERETLLQR